MKEKGTFYGIGVGPGDPELITVKALKVIQSCPVIAAPRTGNGDMVALDIVWRTGVLAETAEIAEESDKADETLRGSMKADGASLSSASADAVNPNDSNLEEANLFNVGESGRRNPPARLSHREHSALCAPCSCTQQELTRASTPRSAGLVPKKILAMDFTMDKDPAKRKENYRKNAEAAARYLENGMDVAMVTLGDVSLYSTVHYIANELSPRGYNIVMIPGVPSFSAAAASLAIPLAEMDAPVHIIPSVRNTSDDYLDLPGTKVLMKAGRHLHRTLDELDRRGLLDVTSLAINCGMDDEILIKKLGDDEPLPDKTGYFTTVIVRD